MAKKFNIPKEEFAIAREERDEEERVEEQPKKSRSSKSSAAKTSKKTTPPAEKKELPAATAEKEEVETVKEEVSVPEPSDQEKRPAWLDSQFGWMRHEKGNKLRRFNTGYDDDIYMWLQKESRRRGMSMTMLVNIALWTYMHGPEGKIKLEE